jgi:UPF0755 protein
MSRVTNEINKVTGTIISVAGKLIFYAVVVLLLVEGCTRGYAFGHAIFCPTAMEATPGTDKVVTITDGQSTGDVASMLRSRGLIDSELILQIQKRFYEYEFHPGTYELNTSMTSKEILQVLNEGTGEEEMIEEKETSAKTTETEAAETTEATEAENRDTTAAAVETEAADTDSDHTAAEITIDQETSSAQAEESDEIEIRIE